MSKPTISRLSSAMLLCLAVSAGPALAAETMTPAEMLARYKSERAACSNGTSQQSRSDCLYEAESAYKEARRGRLDVNNVPYVQNQKQRCEVHRGDERIACLARMQGEGSTTGTAAAGGIYRETTVRRVGDGEPVVVAPPR